MDEDTCAAYPTVSALRAYSGNILMRIYLRQVEYTEVVMRRLFRHTAGERKKNQVRNSSASVREKNE